MFDLSNKTALITGATGGLGSSIAQTLAQANANVILTGRNQQALDELQNKIGKNKSRTITCDLADMKQTAVLFAKAEELFGQVDILINNAGLTKDTLMMRMKEEDFDTVLAVNLKAAFILAKDAARSMIKRRFGRIISLSSVVSVTGNIGQANYAASKAGLIGLSKSLAQELASRSITVNCIAPGFIATPMTDTITNDSKSAILDRIPMRKIGTPQDIAAAVLFLASNEAGYITGQTIHINGGLAMI